MAEGHCANGKAPPLRPNKSKTGTLLGTPRSYTSTTANLALLGPNRSSQARRPARTLNTNLFRVPRRSSVPTVRLLPLLLLCCAAAFASDLKVTVVSPSGDRVSDVQVSLFRASDNAGVATETTGGDGV